MPKRQKYLAKYFSFTRKERRGIIVVITFIILLTILPFLFPFFIKSKPVDHTAFEKEIAQLKLKEDSSSKPAKRNYDDDNYPAYHQPSEKNYYANQSKGELFYFDPNTLPVAGWVKLGIREKTANTIQKYIAKGGKFYKPEDIAKIWGLHEDEVNRLMPYVRIEASSKENFNSTKTTDNYKPYEKPKYAIAAVDVNAADTSAFIALPGIGSKLANRIITFREKLGGFYKIEQVAETYGLADSVYQKIKDKLNISNNAVKQININKATADELKIHPYIRYNIANAIIQYKNQHGNFAAPSDLKKIMIITEDIYNKMAPYLTTQ